MTSSSRRNSINNWAYSRHLSPPPGSGHNSPRNYKENGKDSPPPLALTHDQNSQRSLDYSSEKNATYLYTDGTCLSNWDDSPLDSDFAEDLNSETSVTSQLKTSKKSYETKMNSLKSHISKRRQRVEHFIESRNMIMLDTDDINSIQSPLTKSLCLFLDLNLPPENKNHLCSARIAPRDMTNTLYLYRCSKILRNHPELGQRIIINIDDFIRYLDLAQNITRYHSTPSCIALLLYCCI